MFSRKAKQVSFLAGLALFAITGTSYLSSPSHELAYSLNLLPAVCAEGSCSRGYILKVGNTGRRPQEQVNLAFAPAIKTAAVPPAAYNFGKVRRQIIFDDESESELIMKLGALEPGKIVEIRFVLAKPAGATLPEWPDLFHRIDVSDGPVIKGDPAGTTFLRFIFSLFSL